MMLCFCLGFLSKCLSQSSVSDEEMESDRDEEDSEDALGVSSTDPETEQVTPSKEKKTFHRQVALTSSIENSRSMDLQSEPLQQIGKFQSFIPD